MSSTGGVKRTPPIVRKPPGPLDDPSSMLNQVDESCVEMPSHTTPTERRIASDHFPVAPKVVKSIPATGPVGTPKGFSRGSAKRLALDVLERPHEADSSSTLMNILVLVQKLVDDNSALKKELAEVKQLLNTVISLPSTIAPIKKPTISYASVTKAKKIVVVNPASDKLNAEESRHLIKSKLKPADYNLCGVSSTRKGGVVVECPTSAELTKFQIDAAAQLGDDFIVSAPKGRRPRVRVFGFREQLNAIDLVKVLKEQNDSVFLEVSHVTVAHIFQGKSTPFFGAKLEVDPATFKRLIDAQKVFIGWDTCSVSEDLNIRRCYKCWGFNHVASNCSVTLQRCPKCTGNHHQNECDSDDEKCAVCCDAVSKYNMKIDTNHTVFSSDCPSYVHRVALQHKNINYGGD